jgi:hypothetical protein
MQEIIETKRKEAIGFIYNVTTHGKIYTFPCLKCLRLPWQESCYAAIS